MTLESLEPRNLLSATINGEACHPAALPVLEGASATPTLESWERPVRVGNREIDRWGNTAYILPVPDLSAAPSLEMFSDQGIALAGESVLSLEETFSLQSDPSASKTIYLDFDGHVTTGTIWNSEYNQARPITTPSFSIDLDSQFSGAELERIQYIWQRVAEDFLPFSVNVTTRDPGVEALRKLGSGDASWGIRVVIGGSSADWYNTTGGAAGGVAYVDSFGWTSDTPLFVFPDNLSSGREKFVAEAISHEVGHTLGLRHDGIVAGPGYYEGHGSGVTGWAPILGTGYYCELTQWSRGEYPQANNAEDDLAIITTDNGFGYRPDDHGDHHTAATPLHPTGGTVLAGEGIIEQNTDRDYFSITAGAGTVQLSILPFHRGPNLDILATLYDHSGNVIATSNPPDQLDAGFNLSLAADTYYLAVEGTGKEPWTTGYSDYGSLGYYSISGTVPAVAIRNVGVTVAPTSGLVTTEAEGTAEFTLVLDAAPLANVTIGLSSSDASEGSVSPASVTFTPANWSEPQVVTITGVADTVADGDVSYVILTAAAISDDEAYHGWDPDDASVINLDDDLPLVDTGPQILLPDTPDQTVSAFIEWGGLVSDLRLFVEITGGDSGAGGSSSGPRIGAVDLEGEQARPMIFSGNNNGQYDLGSSEQVQAWGIATATGAVTAQGLLATLSIDTTGLWKDPLAPHAWSLLLADTQLGSTHFLSLDGTRINVASLAGTIMLNTPPIAEASDVTTAEDMTYTFAAADFGFSDADLGDGLTAVRILSLPAAGTLEFDGVPVSGEQELLTADLTAGRLQFRPASDAHGEPYATFEFAVHDGMQYSTASAVMTVQVTAVNDPPTADDQWLSVLVNEPESVTLTGYDVDGDDLEYVIIEPPTQGTLTGIAPDLEYTPRVGFLGTDAFTFLTRDGSVDSPPARVTISVITAPEIVGCYVFYNDSAWDGNDAAANADDDAAIAPDKQALRPGQVAGFAHYTSYVKGLNGLMIDVANLASDATLTSADFQFRVGNSNDLAAWTPASDPSSITLRAGAGAGGATRVTLIWSEQEAVQNRWLQVTVRANANTNLSQDNVFYFGNAIGESGWGNADGAQPLGFFPVNVTDEIHARDHAHLAADPAPLDDAFDFDRDRVVDATDELVARAHNTTFQSALRSIAPPPASPDTPPTGAQDGTGWLFIVVGTHMLQPDMAGQEISIYVLGEALVAGLNLNIQVGDGLLAAPGMLAPVIENVDILTRTIFAANHTGLRPDADNQDGTDMWPYHEYRATTTASGTVIAGGLLATITIDTTGLRYGSWPLVISSTINGPTDFAGLAATIIDGSIVLPPSWSNLANPYDVDDSGRVSPLDALIVISYLNSQSGGGALPAAPASPPHYYDVNDDGQCTAADVLMVVNFINSLEARTTGVGEAELPTENTATGGSLQTPLDALPTLGDTVGTFSVVRGAGICASPPQMPVGACRPAMFPMLDSARSPSSYSSLSARDQGDSTGASDDLEDALAVISADVAAARFGDLP